MACLVPAEKRSSPSWRTFCSKRLTMRTSAATCHSHQPYESSLNATALKEPQETRSPVRQQNVASTTGKKMPWQPTRSLQWGTVLSPNLKATRQPHALHLTASQLLHPAVLKP
ncbi:uncharacterized protein LOC142776504 [Rhipicephalus microplus]|uniref:uncharacterized protein LOC142776504 n=1 Tax=Rhipicephalus microplus TaxID=6941 RepID=UPI003F6D39EA